ncbi:lysosome-associated membrane glycoprotein 5 isoform X1 [Patagioenas fasciata]|uniref:lysosome-associated membrane glycoprotein 5 isoform X1 n=1 Tax=Patagioenas fasciata TaxID=372321 RepID=UPI003A9A16DF
MAGGRLPGLLFLLHAAAHLAAEQEVENLSGLSPNPEKDIFVVRENRTTCLMAEFAAKFIVPYDVWASNYVDLITEQADIPLSRGAEMKGKCGTSESELEISWLEQAYTLKLFFLKEGHNTSRGQEAFWRLSRIQFTYDTSERTYFKDAVSPGKHTASSHRLSALVTPAGKSYECQAQQTISLISSDHQKSVQLLLSEVRVQPFDITADFVFSEELAFFIILVWQPHLGSISCACSSARMSKSHAGKRVNDDPVIQAYSRLWKCEGIEPGLASVMCFLTLVAVPLQAI